MADEADICLIVEGAYPFVAGGVSAWVHALIEAQNHLTFSIVALTPDTSSRTFAYELPANVISFQVLPLHGGARPGKPVAASIGIPLLSAAITFQKGGRLDQLAEVSRLLKPYSGRKAPADFLDSEGVWRAIEAMARTDMREMSFLHFFWSIRSLLSAFLSVMLAPLPPARVYHAVSTGYAGLLAARGRVERGQPVLLTEHGIYTNERRIEIAAADWLYDRAGGGIALDRNHRTLKDLWTDCFAAYARTVYEAADHIVTLFRGNRDMQIRDGAPPEKCLIIPNGIDCDLYGRLPRATEKRAPTIALIGRVVPIKDVKTFVRACTLVKKRLPAMKAYVLGPVEEDQDYYRECVQLARELRLEDTLQFTGRVTIARYLPFIHLNVLTSLSEAQPLVVLEAAAAGIPTVATDVGACRELVHGTPDEAPPLGPGGAVCPLGDAYATAEAILHFLEQPAVLAEASRAARVRANRYYSKARMDETYRRLYDSLRRTETRVPDAPRQAIGAA